MGRNGSKVGFWIAIAILAMLLFGSFLTNLGLLGALVTGSSVELDEHPVDAEPRFTETWSQGYGEAKVVRIELNGVILRGQRERLFGYEPDMVESILQQIRAATVDDSVRAILLEVDSPGGAVTPSDEIYAALNAFKQADEARRVLVFIRDLGASGAYYAAMAGDYIIAEPTAVVGSVGVIMQSLNMKGLSDKLGLSSVTIASGENKDMLNPFEEVDPLHIAMLQKLVDGMQDRFAGIVQQARGIEGRELLDGRILSAPQALEHNFVDQIGYWDDAVAKLSEILGDEELYIVRYQRKRKLFESLMSARVPQLSDINIATSPRFLYLWKP